MTDLPVISTSRSPRTLLSFRIQFISNLALMVLASRLDAAEIVSDRSIPIPHNGWRAKGDHLAFTDQTGKIIRSIPDCEIGELKPSRWDFFRPSWLRAPRLTRSAVIWPDGSAALLCEGRFVSHPTIEPGTEGGSVEVSETLRMYDQFGSVAWSRTNVDINYGIWFSPSYDAIVYVQATFGPNGCLGGAYGEEFQEGCNEFLVVRRKIGGELRRIGPFAFLLAPHQESDDQWETRLSPSGRYLATEGPTVSEIGALGPWNLIVIDLLDGTFRRANTNPFRRFRVTDEGIPQIASDRGEWIILPLPSSN